MMKKLALSLLVLTTYAAAGARAETMKHEAGGIQFDVPEGWSHKADGDMIQVTNAEGSLSVLFWVAGEDNWEKALDAVATELDKVIHEAKIEEEAEEGEHNGLKTVEMSGSGKVEGTAMDWSLTLFAAKKPVIALAMAEPSAWEKDGKAIEAFVGSVKPAE
jgi:hypothetical protein